MPPTTAATTSKAIAPIRTDCLFMPSALEDATAFRVVERVRTKLAALEELYLAGLMSTRDSVEGLTAFLEKRPARWEDR